MVITEKLTKNLLTASKIGRYAINPYLGYPQACKYCCASFMKDFTNQPETWGGFLDVNFHHEEVIKTEVGKILGKNQQ